MVSGGYCHPLFLLTDQTSPEEEGYALLLVLGSILPELGGLKGHQLWDPQQEQGSGQLLLLLCVKDGPASSELFV